MSKWKDQVKSFSDSTVVSSEIKLGNVKLSVHRHIHHHPSVWLSSCSIFFSQTELLEVDLEKAKCEATEMLRLRLQNCLDQIIDIV